MSYQPLYATLSDDHGTVHTHCLRGRQEAIDGRVNTDIGELMRFYIRYDGENVNKPIRKAGENTLKKNREPSKVTGRINFPPNCVVTCEGNEVHVALYEYEEPSQEVIKRLKEGNK